MCVGFSAEDVAPSPKFHKYEVAPLEVLLQTNVVTPATPLAGVTLNDAVTEAATVALAVFEGADSPAELKATT